MVNHAMKNEMAKITDYICHIMHWMFKDGKRGEAEEKKRVVSC